MLNEYQTCRLLFFLFVCFLDANTLNSNNHGKRWNIKKQWEKSSYLNWVCPPQLPTHLSKWNLWRDQKHLGQHLHFPMHWWRPEDIQRRHVTHFCCIIFIGLKHRLQTALNIHFFTVYFTLGSAWCQYGHQSPTLFLSKSFVCDGQPIRRKLKTFSYHSPV